MLFTPDVLEQLKQQASQSMLDTFNVMFSQNLSVCDHAGAASKEFTQASIKLSSDQATTWVNIKIPNPTATNLVRSFQGDDVADPHAAQDVTCEIANIVGHAIRSYLLSLPGVTFTVGLPQAGNAVSVSPDTAVLSMHFTDKTAGIVDVDLTYPKSV